MKLLIADLAATERLAAQLALRLQAGVRIFLTGDLGVGKTQFTRSLLRGLGHTGRVRSPTFTLLESYKLLKFDLYHFDFYRFSGDNEWRDIGFDELLSDPHSVSVVEWPQMAGTQLPAPDLWLKFETTDEPAGYAAPNGDDEPSTQRILEINASGDWATAWLRHLSENLAQTRGEGISLLPD